MDELDLTLDQDNFDKLGEDHKPLYKKGEDGLYSLKFKIKGVKTQEDVDNIDRAKAHEVENRKKAEKELKEANAKLQALEAAEETRKQKEALETNDITALNESWEAKHKALEDSKSAEVAALKAEVESLTLGTTAQKIAESICIDGVAELIQPKIRERLKSVKAEDGTVSVKVLDAQGNLSALTLDELAKEFATMPNYAKVMKAPTDASSSKKDNDDFDNDEGRKQPKLYSEMSNDQLVRSIGKKINN